MLYSMTGFGKAETNVNDILARIEIRSLNSKGLDINIRLPQNIKSKELQIRNILSKELKRGKIDVYISLDLPANEQTATINKEAFDLYFRQIKGITNSEDIREQDVFEAILKLPSVMVQREEEISDSTWSALELLLKEAIVQLTSFRKTEGQKMESELRSSITNIQDQLKEIPQYEAERVDKVRERMLQGLTSIAEQIDVNENRLEQELVFYIEKFDITEEKVRLTAHLEHFLDLLNQEEHDTKGKKLSFISQEIGREINTIGSKANHLSIQKHVVNMKDYLEQIKEQLSNIL